MNRLAIILALSSQCSGSCTPAEYAAANDDAASSERLLGHEAFLAVVTPFLGR
jgi:hypothetical protein